MFFWTFYSNNLLFSKKVSVKKQHYVFNIDKCFLTTKSFLKDHVTLKTAVMTAKNQLCHHRNKLHFKMENISHSLFLLYFSHINAT